MVEKRGVVGPALKIREGWSGASRKRGAVAKMANQMISRPHLKPPHHSEDFVARRSCATRCAEGHVRRYVSHTLYYLDDCRRTKPCRFRAVVTLTAPLDGAYCTAGRFIIDSWQRLPAAAWPCMDHSLSGTHRRRDSYLFSDAEGSL